MNSTELSLEHQVKLRILEMHVQGLYNFTKCLIQIKQLQQFQVSSEQPPKSIS